MSLAETEANPDFNARLNGRFEGLLRWEDLDALWSRLRDGGEAWYFYQVGSPLPDGPIAGEALERALAELDALLHKDHDHDYCGIVYADDPRTPSLIKVYDPNNLGSSCGSSGQRIPPRWILSLQRPQEVVDEAPMPGNRRRWWHRLFG